MCTAHCSFRADSAFAVRLLIKSIKMLATLLRGITSLVNYANSLVLLGSDGSDCLGLGLSFDFFAEVNQRLLTDNLFSI